MTRRPSRKTCDQPAGAVVLLTRQASRRDELIQAVKDWSDVIRGDVAATGDAELTALYAAWRKAERACYWQVRRIYEEGPHPEADGPETDAVFQAFDAATVALTRAINEMISGDGLVREARPRLSLPQRITSLVRRRRSDATD